MGQNRDIRIGAPARRNLPKIPMNDADYEKIRGCVSSLAAYDDVMMAWLNASEDNREAFLKDPVGTFRKVANPGADTLGKLDVMKTVGAEKMSSFYQAYMEPGAEPGNVSEAAGVAQEDACVAAGAADVAQEDVCITAGADDAVQKWDMTASAKVGELNKIVKWAYGQLQIPTSFVYQNNINFGVFDMTAKVDVELDVPGITGGTGQQIDITFPIKKGTLSILDINTGATLGSWDIGTDARVILTIDLKCVEAVGQDNSPVYRYYINFGNKFIVNARAEGFPDEINEKFTDGLLDKLFQALLEALLDNREIFLCEVSQNSVKGYEYLMPTYARPYFTEMDDIDSSLLSILVLTVSKTTSELAYEIDTKAIPTDSEASILFSEELFLKYMIQSSMNSQYPKAGFELLTDSNTGGLYIQNKNSFQTEKVSGYTPTVTKMKLLVSNGFLEIHAEVTVTPTSGISLNYKADGTFSLDFKDGGSSGQQLEMVKQDYTSSHTLDIADWVWAVAAIAAIATVFIGVLGLLLVGISESLVAIIGAIIDSKAPGGIDVKVFTDSVKSVKWNHTELLSFTDILLKDGLGIGMNLNFADES